MLTQEKISHFRVFCRPDSIFSIFFPMKRNNCRISIISLNDKLKNNGNFLVFRVILKRLKIPKDDDCVFYRPEFFIKKYYLWQKKKDLKTFYPIIISKILKTFYKLS